MKNKTRFELSFTLPGSEYFILITEIDGLSLIQFNSTNEIEFRIHHCVDVESI